jgi:nucleoid-associated protein YgaU/DNA-binding SARP family transcriptional activator
MMTMSTKRATGPSRGVSLFRAATNLIRLAAVVVGVPWLLTRFVGWPLPHGRPTVRQVLDGFTVGAYDDKIFLKIIACVAWLAWAMIICSLTIHVVGLIRQVKVGKPRLIHPRLFAMTAKWLSGVTLVATSVTSRAGVAGAQTLPTTTVSTPVVPLSVDTGDVASPLPRVSVEGNRTYTVRGGETLWTVAEQTYGDGSQWQRIYDANKTTLTNPEVLPTGTVLTLPGLTATPTGEVRASGAQPSVVEASANNGDGDAPILGTVTVVKGDHFWKISEEVLTQAYGRPVTDAETGPYWRAMVELNRSHVGSGDVNLIYAGENYQVQLPDLPVDVLDRTITLPRVVSRVDTPLEIPGLVEPVSEPVAERVPIEEPVSAAPVVVAPVAVPPTITPVGQTSDSDGSMMAVFAGLGLTAISAGALLIALRRRRATAARIRGVGEQLESPTEDMMSLLSRLRAIAQVDVTTTVDSVQRLLRQSLANSGTAVPSVLVARVGLNGVELLLDEPLTTAPPEFVCVDDGHCWVLSPDVTETQLVRARSNSTGFMPALVSIGANEIGSVLVDLERLGALEIRCDDNTNNDTGIGVLAAMAAEWEGAPWMDREEAHIVAIGLPSALFGAYERVRQIHDTDLADEVQRLVDRAHSDAMRYPAGTHVERVATDAFVFGPTVVLVGPDHGEEAMMLAEAALVSGSGLAVVALTGLPRGSSQLVITGTAAVLEPFGLDLDRFVMLEPDMALAVAHVVESSDEIRHAEPWPHDWDLDNNNDDGASDDEFWFETDDHDHVSAKLVSSDEYDDEYREATSGSGIDEELFVDSNDSVLAEPPAPELVGEPTIEQFVDLSRFDTAASETPEWSGDRNDDRDESDQDDPDDEPDDEPDGNTSIPEYNNDTDDMEAFFDAESSHVVDGGSDASLVLAGLAVRSGTVGLSLLGDAMPMLVGVDSPSGRSAPRSIELLTFLALNGPRTQAQILEALWPDRTDQATVVQAVSRIRKTIGSATITFDDGRYHLQGLDCDWTRFLALVDAANRFDRRDTMMLLRAALELVRSRPFAGRQIYDGRASSWDWLDLGYVESDVLVRIVDVAESYAQLALRAGDGPAALWSCEIVRMCEPRREATHTLRMRAFALLGDRDGLHREVRQAVESATLEDPLADNPPNVMQLLRVLEEKLSCHKEQMTTQHFENDPEIAKESQP